MELGRVVVERVEELPTLDAELDCRRTKLGGVVRLDAELDAAFPLEVRIADD